MLCGLESYRRGKKVQWFLGTTIIFVERIMLTSVRLTSISSSYSCFTNSHPRLSNSQNRSFCVKPRKFLCNSRNSSICRATLAIHTKNSSSTDPSSSTHTQRYQNINLDMFLKNGFGPDALCFLDDSETFNFSGVLFFFGYFVDFV